ncbi:hypothetical protein [Thiothrix unzii]|uniref:Uncharacterized protein n=1 Tax=Thiothrix unzii TaxID=111769 RepID=A0A975IJP3_9GAMM|nr:hypothetical protein [Thiothrix unzii]QTR55460.1 hypothetical protein J9260_18360 [Thiothrix unzii]QTR55470.1 hypothetical protein J9260_18310 [Thiothrix unzii]
MDGIIVIIVIIAIIAAIKSGNRGSGSIGGIYDGDMKSMKCPECRSTDIGYYISSSINGADYKCNKCGNKW